jgi:hypothetical protein
MHGLDLGMRPLGRAVVAALADDEDRSHELQVRRWRAAQTSMLTVLGVAGEDFRDDLLTPGPDGIPGRQLLAVRVRWNTQRDVIAGTGSPRQRSCRLAGHEDR